MMTSSSVLLLLLLAATANAALIVGGPQHTASYYMSATADRHLQYHSQDSLGQYSYGYTGGPSSKTETKTLDGITRGSYSYVDANGLLQTVEYTADAINGFRAAATNLPKAPKPIDAHPQLMMPVAETAEVAAARAEHMAAYEAALRRDEPEQPQSQQAQRDEEEADAFRPRVVTPAQQTTLLMPATFAYGWPNAYYSVASGGYPTLYAPHPQAFVRPAGFQYAFYPYNNPLLANAALPTLLAGQQSHAEPNKQPEPQDAVAEVSLLRQADRAEQKRPFVVTDTVAVRAEKLVAKLRNVAKPDNEKKN